MKKKLSRVPLALVLAFSLLLSAAAFSSCETEPETGPVAERTTFVMDTFLSVALYRLPESGETAEEDALFSEGFALVKDLEDRLSRTKEGSEIYAFNEAESSYVLSEETASLIARALAMSEATGGAYDITTAPLTELWNVAGGGPVPNDDALAEALSHVSYRKLTLSGTTLYKSDPAVRIDLGSVAKGYALGKLCDFYAARGVTALVNFGGNVGLVGEKAEDTPWRVSLRSPFSSNESAGSFTLSCAPAGAVSGTASEKEDTGHNAAAGGKTVSFYVAVSGDYERYFEADGQRYHHILSPFDGRPARGIRSAAVTAPDAADADMLSTALFVMGPEAAAAWADTLASEYGATYVLIPDDGVLKTGGLSPETFSPA